jgi:capsular exopolysaccharide synthesis family protein
VVLEDHFSVVAEGEQHDYTAIRIVSESGIPNEAELIANTFASEYISRARDASRRRLRSMSTFLDEQEDKLRGRVTSLEDSLRVFMTTQGAVALDQEASQMVIQIAQLEALRDQTRIDREMIESSLRSLEDELSKIEPNLVQRVASNVDEELTGIQQQITSLELRAGEYYQRDPSLREDPSKNSTLVELVQRIDALRAMSNELSERYVNEVLAAGGVNPSSPEGGLTYVSQQKKKLAESRIALRSMEAQETVVRQRLAAYRSRLDRVPAQSIELARLQRELKSAENLYIYIVEKSQEVALAEESEIGYAEIIRPAARPHRPARPNRRRILVVSVMVGLMAGAGFVLLRSNMDDRIESAADLIRLGHRIVGTVPDTTKIPAAGLAATGTESLDNLEGLDKSLIVLTSPLSIASESYRRICTSIRYSRRTDNLKVFLITSPEPEEGKTTTAANIALAMSEAGNRTALVDMDLRLPRIHTLLHLAAAPGVTDLLESNGPIDLDRFETSIAKLSFIPAGALTTNPSKLLASSRLSPFIRQLRESFDVVIIDSPPVLAFDDARVITALCDGTIMVAAAAKTGLRSYGDVSQLLEDIGTTVVGCVLNMVSTRPGVEYYPRYAAHYARSAEGGSHSY